ncbi:hypothetical protein HU200_060839 [Digitaria exilis]|uniref:Uncharacterized protein n=1 Tax=Digitaria exilis TaxID=1010633 RepID=A0A835ABH2_9POAL|nr:hypothetical protein HU200_060839 [Digitaria exilis]
MLQFLKGLVQMSRLYFIRWKRNAIFGVWEVLLLSRSSSGGRLPKALSNLVCQVGRGPIVVFSWHELSSLV